MQEDQDNNVVEEVAKEAAKQAARQAKQEAKEAVKKAVRDALKKVLLAVAKSPVFWIIVAVILVLTILLAGVHYVIQKNKIKSYKDEKAKITTESGFFNIGKTIFNNGVYEYEFEDKDLELADKLLIAMDYDPTTFTNFEKYVLVKVSNVKENALGQLTMDLDLEDYSEQELHLLPKFVEAELKTMYPDLGGNTSDYRDSFQGNVKIIRNGSNLKYKPEEEFNLLIETNNDTVLNYFTLDEGFNLSVANKVTSNSNSQLTGDEGHSGNDGNITEVTYIKTTVPYMSTIQKFATPYPFFFTLLTITEDANFCEDVVNLALQNQIELTVYDEVTTITDVYVEEGTAKVDYNYVFKLEYDYEEDGTEVKNKNYNYTNYKELDQEEQYTKTTTTTNVCTTPKIIVSKANTIFWDIENTYKEDSKTEPESVTTGGPNTQKIDPMENIREDTIGSSVKYQGLKSDMKSEITEEAAKQGRTIDIKNIDIKTGTNWSYRTVWVKARTVKTKNTENISKTEYVVDDSQSKLDFKDEGKGGFYDILINDEYRYKTTEHIYELQDRLYEFFSDTLDSADIYINIFEYMKSLITGLESSVDIGSIMGQIASGNELTAVGMVGGYIVDTTKSSENLVLNGEQLKTAIEKWAGSGTRRTNLDSVGASKFIELQNKYNVNAVFAIAVFQQENGCGANKNAKLIKNNTYNWGSVKGSYNGNSWIDASGNKWCKYPSYTEATEAFMKLIKNNYFSEGKISVETISEKYCPGSPSWSTGVAGIMTAIYKAAGVNVSEQKNVSGGNGYTTTYTNQSGKEFKEYKQNGAPYSNQQIYGPGNTISNVGCGVTSVSIVASGYGINKDPYECYSLNSNLTNSLRAMGLTVTEMGRFEGRNTGVQFDKNKIIEHLKSGNPVIIYVLRSAGSTFTSNKHYMALLDVKDNGNQIYVSDPWNTGHTGWQPATLLFQGAVGAKLVSK